MLKLLIPIAAAAVLGACGYVSEYEKAVYDYEPAYCYKSLAGVQCFKAPNHRDERRLVNYFGPHPSRYERPAPPPAPQLSPPPPVDFYVRDAEPIPSPAAPMKAASLAAPQPRPEGSAPREPKTAVVAPVGESASPVEADNDISGEAVTAPGRDAADGTSGPVPAAPPPPGPVSDAGI